MSVHITCVGVFSFTAVEADEDAEVDDDPVTNEGTKYMCSSGQHTHVHVI